VSEGGGKEVASHFVALIAHKTPNLICCKDTTVPVWEFMMIGICDSEIYMPTKMKACFIIETGSM
jgi:hypothetical protein